MWLCIHIRLKLIPLSKGGPCSLTNLSRLSSWSIAKKIKLQYNSTEVIRHSLYAWAYIWIIVFSRFWNLWKYNRNCFGIGDWISSWTPCKLVVIRPKFLQFGFLDINVGIFQPDIGRHGARPNPVRHALIFHMIPDGIRLYVWYHTRTHTHIYIYIHLPQKDGWVFGHRLMDG